EVTSKVCLRAGDCMKLLLLEDGADIDIQFMRIEPGSREWKVILKKESNMEKQYKLTQISHDVRGLESVQ
ncbi:hypothetical protein L9F63_003725, partial [Diploptera punctata]